MNVGGNYNRVCCIVVMEMNRLSGKDEKNGKIVLYDGKVSYVKGRIGFNTKCEHPKCDKSDTYLVCKGAQTRLSTLHTICCREHLDWAIQRALTKPLGELDER